MHGQIKGFSSNGLLRGLQRRDYQAIEPCLDRIVLKPNRVLHHAKAPIEHVYFPEEGLISVLADVGHRQLIEVWLTGREGMVGTPALLGIPSSRHRRIVHVGGSALQMRRRDLEIAMRDLPALRAHFLRYAYVVLVQTSQIGACNAKHQVGQRLARWILMAQDRSGEDPLPLTQNTLSRMLGVRRATVTQCIATMERRRLIAKSRGSIRILDRAGLEGAACPCYGIIRTQYDQMMDHAFATEPCAFSGAAANGAAAGTPAGLA
jgi:CRP-like cAMP-binding protein